MFNWLKKECTLCFAAGAVTGVLGLKLAKTKKVREFAVKGIAQGMMAKDCAVEGLANLREEAEEICNEARAVAKENSDCDCKCECTSAE